MASSQLIRRRISRLNLLHLLLASLLATVTLAGCGDSSVSSDPGGSQSARCSPEREGQRRALVPDVWGQTLSNATTHLCWSGFSEVIAHDAAGAEPDGAAIRWIVAQQNPAPGQRISLDREVRLLVIAGPPRSTTTTQAPHGVIPNNPAPTTRPEPTPEPLSLDDQLVATVRRLAPDGLFDGTPDAYIVDAARRACDAYESGLTDDEVMDILFDSAETPDQLDGNVTILAAATTYYCPQYSL